MYFWAREYPVSDAAEEAEVQQKTAIDIYQWIREVCSTRLLTSGHTVLGGPGAVVEIDESLFRHKPKVIQLSIDPKCYSYTTAISNYRIIEEELPLGRCGCLVWSTPPNHLL